ncbi:SsgA family sporulation/cell division regulator [Streptomyces sp. NPDC056161]|uniref:SsgA family sporulation/cell division regulator n=1 Tax=Streptomyces sp. NPDC056161 TaxID=3345732 RepID=UPI0035DFFF84
MRLFVSYDQPVSMRVTLRYDDADPYAVRAAFYPAARCAAVEWFLSRDMLEQALSRHTGHGDVRMWPAGGAGRAVVYIALRTPAGSALLELPARGVASFLRDTRSVVPPGAESRRLDLDTELAELLADG